MASSLSTEGGEGVAVSALWGLVGLGTGRGLGDILIWGQVCGSGRGVPQGREVG